MNQERTYRVETEERTYNDVQTVWQFIHRIRPNWNDFTQIVAVQVWQDGQGWQELNPIEWVENNQ